MNWVRTKTGASIFEPSNGGEHTFGSLVIVDHDDHCLRGLQMSVTKSLLAGRIGVIDGISQRSRPMLTLSEFISSTTVSIERVRRLEVRSCPEIP